MDGFFVAKLKKFSNVIPKPKDEDEGVNGEQVNELPVEEENEPSVECTPQKEKKVQKEKKGESSQVETSPDQSISQDVKDSANKKKKKKKRKSESSQTETNPEKSLTEGVKSPVKKRKTKNSESESSQVETSPEKSVTQDVESPKKRKKRRKKKKAMMIENSETSEIFTSPNGMSTSDKSLMQVEEKAKKRKHEQAHTGDEASPPKERRLGPAENGIPPGLNRSQRRRLKFKLKKKKLAEGGQEVTTTLNGKAHGGAQEKPLQNLTEKENQSVPTLSDTQASKKAKRRRKKKKIGMGSDKPNFDASAQPLDTSVEPEAAAGDKKKKKKRRKKKLHSVSVTESTGDSVPKRVWESGDVSQSVKTEAAQASKENKPHVKAAKIKGKVASKHVAFKTSVANKRLKKQKKRAKVSVGL